MLNWFSIVNLVYFAILLGVDGIYPWMNYKKLDQLNDSPLQFKMEVDDVDQTQIDVTSENLKNFIKIKSQFNMF